MLKNVDTTNGKQLTQSELNSVMGEHERYLARQGGCRAMLRSANLNGLVLASRNLSEADLSGCTLVGANLYGTNLTRSSLYCADLRDCNLQNSILERADLRGVSFAGANLSYAVLNYADLRAAAMMMMADTVEIKGNTNGEKILGAVDFSNCSLRNASFGNARLDNVNFSGALLHGALFRGARLRNACFKGAILFGVNLGDLNVPQSALRDCLLEPSQSTVDRAAVVLTMLKAHHEWVISNGSRGTAAVVDREDLRPLANALKGLCLAGLSARHIVAVSVDFSGCQLQAARFDGSDLRAAQFTNADLSGICLDHTNLAHACFRNAVIKDLTLRDGRTVAVRAFGAQATRMQFSEARNVSGEFLSEFELTAK